MKTLKLSTLLLFGAILLLTGCDKDKDNDPIAVNSVVITPATLELNLGQTAQLTAKITPANAPNKTVTWGSSNTTVATVSASGEVTAIAAGSTTITVTTQDGHKAATCAVTVTTTTVGVTGVTLNKTTLSLVKDAKETLVATVAPENTTDKTVIWLSSDETIATVSASGEVTAVKVGTATIMATSVADNSKTATCAVTVTAATVAVTGVTLNKNATSLNVGATETLTATVNPTNATNKNVTWSSSNTAIATVSASGVVTAKSAGTATITVTTQDGGKKATCTVTVKADTPVNPDTDIDGWGDQGNINNDVQKQ